MMSSIINIIKDSIVKENQILTPFAVFINKATSLWLFMEWYEAQDKVNTIKLMPFHQMLLLAEKTKNYPHATEYSPHKITRDQNLNEFYLHEFAIPVHTGKLIFGKV